VHLDAGQRDDDSGGARAQQDKDDAPAQRQEQDQRGGQNGVLPAMGEGPGQRDGRAEDGADGGRPSAVEEGPRVTVAPDLVEPGPAEQDERERRAECDHRGENAANQAGCGVADNGDGLDDRAGGDLA
jgi:hypothetical protein